MTTKHTSHNSTKSRYLYEYVKKKVDLSEFLESIGCQLQWLQPGVTARTTCPIHKETKPSFNIKYLEEEEIWIFNCLGCGTKGTIIDFFIDYYGLNSASEAIWKICKRFGFKKDLSFITDSLKDVKRKINIQKKN